MSFKLYGADEHLPPASTRPLAAASEFEQGALLVVNTAGAFAECEANPALIAAVALSAAGVGSGPLYPVGSKEFPPGYMTAIGVENQRLTADYMGTLGTILTDYGVTEDSDGFWKVDFSKTGGSARVKYLGLVQEGPNAGTRVVCRVIAANTQAV